MILRKTRANPENEPSLPLSASRADLTPGNRRQVMIATRFRRRFRF
jgi:hypothetical protein